MYSRDRRRFPNGAKIKEKGSSLNATYTLKVNTCAYNNGPVHGGNRDRGECMCVRLCGQASAASSQAACRQARHTRAPLPPTPPPPPLPRSAARRWPVAVPASVGVAMQKRSRCRKVVVRPLPHAAAVVARPLAERDRRLDARDQRAAAQSFHARIDDGRRRLGQTCKITSRTGDRGVSNRITSGSASVTRRRVSRGGV